MGHCVFTELIYDFWIIAIVTIDCIQGDKSVTLLSTLIIVAVLYRKSAD